jgi:putative hemolysin
MTLWAEYFVRLLVMVALLFCSAYCSGSETAFFSLSKRQVKQLRDTGHRLPGLVADLLLKPADLLGALLLGNLIVNTLFFATDSVLILKVEQHLGVAVAAVVGLVTFLCLVLFGEILPKSLAYAHPERYSVWLVLPTVIVVRVLAPVVMVFRWLIAEPALRLLLGTGRRHQTVTAGEFKALIDATQERGLINDQQGRLFAEVVTFNLLRVRHVMRPRVDMVACSVNEDSARAQRLMMDRCVTTLVVYRDQIDNVLGAVELRDLVLAPDVPLADLLHPVPFIPEQQTVESLLQFFRKRRVDSAVVVDEYGGVAGSVSVEDVAEELFGPLHFHEATEPVVQLGPGCYRVSGSLPIHDWIKAFDLRPVHTGVATVGGWVTALLGRIPKPNDVARWRHVTLTVERMRKHRVASVILTLEDEHD